VAIECPYCDHRINLKAAKAGRFRPSCPKCGKPFIIFIPSQAGAAIQVRSVPTDTIASPVGAGAQRKRANVCEETPPAEGQSSPFAFDDRLDSDDNLVEFAKTSPAARHAPSAQKPPEQPQPKPQADKSFLNAQVQGYTIERELGRGGMGSVFLARQLSLDRQVALKVMSKRWATDPVFVARFTREAYAAAQLSHPNIVQIHDIGEVEGTRFFSMEYVRGRSLAELVRGQGKLDPETAVGYVLQAARGLKHAHDRGMIHRDVKPDNLLLDDQGLVKVADLGLVKTPTI